MADSLSSIPGVASGVDWKALAEAISAQDKVPATRLQTQVDVEKKQQEALNGLRSLLTTLGDAAKSLSDGSALDAYSTTIAGTATNGRALFSAVAGKGAVAGSYAIEVKALVQAQKRVGAAALPPTGALAGVTDGSFTIDGQSVAVSASDTLIDLRDRINALNTTANANGKTGVTASIIGAGAADARLVLTADKPGVAGGFALADGGTGTLASLGLDGADTPPAQDATIVVDGVPVSRGSNTIGDAIPGVTITATTAEIGKTATLNVDLFTDGARGGVQAFVDAYNKVVDWVKKESSPAGTLKSDSLPRSLRSALATTLLTDGAGAVAGLTTLGMAGVSVDKTGKLSLDATKFDAAYKNRQADLRTLFADRFATMKSLTDGFTKGGGTLDSRAQTLTTSTDHLTKRIQDITDRADRKRTQLLARFAAAEATLGRLKSIGESLGAQINGLNAKSDS